MTAQPSPGRLSIATADGSRINVLRLGRGRETLVLVHGFGENAHSWGELSPDIASAHAVLAVDLRGHGDSDWDPRGQYRLDPLVSDLGLVLDQLQIDSFCIAGHSLGAVIALRLAILRPRAVRKLVLVELNLDALPDDVLECVLAQFDAQFRVYHSPADFHASLEAQRPVADRGALLRYAQHSLRPRKGGGYEIKCDPALRRLPYDLSNAEQCARTRHELSRLNGPLLLVRGFGSAILTKAAAQQIVSLAPNARLASVPGAGHSVMLDRPTEFNEIMARFLLTRD